MYISIPLKSDRAAHEVALAISEEILSDTTSVKDKLTLMVEEMTADKSSLNTPTSAHEASEAMASLASMIAVAQVAESISNYVHSLEEPVKGNDVLDYMCAGVVDSENEQSAIRTMNLLRQLLPEKYK